MLRRIFMVWLPVVFVVALLSSPSQAFEGQSSPLPLGTVDNITPVACPAGFEAGMTCYTATLENCAGTDSLGLTYGVETPSGAVKGTIVLHAGDGGRGPFGYGYPMVYFSAGYQVVQLAWDSDWESVGIGQPTSSIKAAACRPATFFEYLYTNVHGGPSGSGGMCLQGHSAGSAAVAYSLTEYGAGSYVDKALLTSGPVFGNILVGCKVLNYPPVTICPPGQLGCNGASWNVAPQYKPGQVSGWTGDPTCNNVPPGHKTSQESNQDWMDMSVVDGESDSVYSYPQTALSAWLCSNGLNNSAPEGELYYENFTSINQFANNGTVAFYSVNRVDQCPGKEDIWDGVVLIKGRRVSGFQASTADMLDPVVGCVKRH